MHMKELFWTSKDRDSKNYIEIGIDQNAPLVYVYKNNKLIDSHVSYGTTFSGEMQNIINTYIKVHQSEPTITEMIKWRTWFKMLKNNDIIK